MIERSNIIVTQHPEGKKGANISRTDYHLICESIFSVLQQTEKLTLNELIDQVQHRYNTGLVTNLAWRILMVKLDLEAKGLIKVVPHKFDRHTVYLKLNRREWKKLYGRNRDRQSTAMSGNHFPES